MIISDDKTTPIESESSHLALQIQSLEQLPLYTPTVSDDFLTPSSLTLSSVESRSSLADDFAPPTKPTNFLSLSRTNGSIRGSYLIDPELAIPDAALPPLPRQSQLATGEVRKNVQLEVTNGAIKVELRVLPPANHRSTRIRPATISLASRNGSVSAKIHSTATPVSLRVTSQNGSVQLYLPRFFCGPLTIHVRHGACTASSALANAITVLAERGNTRHAFVGDLARSGWGTRDPRTWAGDMLTLEVVNGSIKLCFLDDDAMHGAAPVKSSAWVRSAAFQEFH